MSRGKAATDGDTNTSPNGYHYTRVAGKWRLTHHLIAEKKLGRPIGADELVCFHDGDRTNLSPDNICLKTRKTSLAGKIAALDAKIMELTAERERLAAILKKQKREVV